MSDIPVFQRRGYSATAVETLMVGDIKTNSTALAVTSGEGATYPAANFFIVIDPATNVEDVVFVTSRTGDTFQGLIGLDFDHSSGATIGHRFTAQDADEANAFVATLRGRGSLITRGDTDGPQELPVGSDGLPLVAASTSALGLAYKQIGPGALAALSQLGAMFVAGTSGVVGELAPGDPLTVLQRATTAPLGVQWTDIGLDAWATTWAPTITQGVTMTYTTLYSHWVKQGRRVEAVGGFHMTSTGTPNSYVEVSLPTTAVDAEAIRGNFVHITATQVITGMAFPALVPPDATKARFIINQATSTVPLGGSGTAFTLATGQDFRVWLSYEASA